jgi:NADPH-dependent curcumin reductase CurA
VPPFELGKPLEGGAVGEVIESRAKEFKPGDAVTSNFGWREYFIASPKELHPVSREIQPLSVYLGALGMTGMTAWAGLNLVEVKAGDVIYISGAAGAVGNVAGQLAKLRGCRVIGSAGSAWRRSVSAGECGFDIAFDYKDRPGARTTESWRRRTGSMSISTMWAAKRSKRRSRLCGCMAGSSPVAASPVTTRKSRAPALPIYST